MYSFVPNVGIPIVHMLENLGNALDDIANRIAATSYLHDKQMPLLATCSRAYGRWDGSPTSDPT